MAFLVGVALPSTRPVTPTRCVQRLRSAVACAGRSALADLSRGRIALPPQGGGRAQEREASAVFDIKWIRDNPDAFDAGLKRRGIAPGGDVKFSAELIALDEKRREVVTRLQEAQARRNAASKEIGKAKGAKDEAKAAALMAEVAALKDALAKGEDEQRAADKALQRCAVCHPQHAARGRAGGQGRARQRGAAQGRHAAEARRRQQAAAALRDRRAARPDGLRDGGQAVRRALRGAEGRAGAHGARARRVHARHAHAPEKNGIGGYTEIAPPILVRDDAMYGTAQLPKFAGGSVCNAKQCETATKISNVGTVQCQLQIEQKIDGCGAARCSVTSMQQI